MQEFKSKTGTSLGNFVLMTLPLCGLLYILLHLTINLKLAQITVAGWLIIGFMYSAVLYLYAGFTNNNILVFENRLEVVNNLPLFKKRVVLSLIK
jgi:hypothetical protein